jgi:hypothetical protein
MEHVCGRVLGQYLRDPLPITQVTLYEPQVRQLWERIGTMQAVSTDYVPTLFLEELHQMRANESLGSGNECSSIHV